MAMPTKLSSMFSLEIDDVPLKLFTASLKCYGRIKDQTLSVLMPLDQIDNFFDESFKVEFAKVLKGGLEIDRVSYIPWNEPSSTALAPSAFDFSQITRAVINNSSLFWGEGFIKIVCDEDVFNLALGDGVREEIKESVRVLCSGEQPVINIQCKK